MRYQIIKISTALLILACICAIIAFSRIFQNEEVIGPAKVFFVVFLVSYGYSLYVLAKKDID